MANKPNHSNVSIQVTGQMSEADAGTMAKIHAWRELIRDIGKLLIHAIWIGIATWHGGSALKVMAVNSLNAMLGT